MSVKLPDDLIPIDALMQRWGRGIEPRSGGGLSQLEQIRIFGILVGPSTDTSQWIDIIDREVSKAPSEVRATVVSWYRSHVPASIKAQRAGISRATLYDRWRGSLRYMQGALRGKLSSAI